MALFTLCRLLLVLTLSSQADTSCYYPDGTYKSADRPCIDNGTQESFCCGSQGVICLSDKVCYNNQANEPFTYVRGSCTDQSFKSSACPQFCLSSYFSCIWTSVTDKVMTIAPSNEAGFMFQCGYSTDSYCCSSDGSPCSCENDNITLASSISDVSSINFIPSAASTTTDMTFETQVMTSSVTKSTWPRKTPLSFADMAPTFSYRIILIHYYDSRKNFRIDTVELNAAIYHTFDLSVAV